MKLSVLIPTYDHKCYTLVFQLQEQLEKLAVPYEIIVAEDGSKDLVSIISNHRINELPHCRHIRREMNVGRAAIRNFLADEATGEWLLFMDSDGKVVKDDFVKLYLDAATPNNDVILGGWIHPEQCPSPEQSLRWKYEKTYEQNLNLETAGFRSFCFMIRREMFMQVRFDERYKYYGWEDNRFGIQLKEAGCRFAYINNPLMNADIETNSVFVAKTEQAMQTLHQFHNELQDIRLLNLANKIQRWHLTWLAKGAFWCTKRTLKHNLTGKSPNLKVFATYKIGYYLSL